MLSFLPKSFKCRKVSNTNERRARPHCYALIHLPLTHHCWRARRHGHCTGIALNAREIIMAALDTRILVHRNTNMYELLGPQTVRITRCSAATNRRSGKCSRQNARNQLATLSEQSKGKMLQKWRCVGHYVSFLVVFTQGEFSAEK